MLSSSSPPYREGNHMTTTRLRRRRRKCWRKRHTGYLMNHYPPALSGNETISVEEAAAIALSYQQDPGLEGCNVAELTRGLNQDDVRLIYFSFRQEPELLEEGEVPGFDECGAHHFYTDWIGTPPLPPLPRRGRLRELFARVSGNVSKFVTQLWSSGIEPDGTLAGAR